MKKAFKAFSAKEKLYQINRINSKLVHFSYNKNLFEDIYEGKSTILQSITNIKNLLNCFDPPKKGRRYKDYLESIVQIENKLLNKDYDNMTVLFGYMGGCFERFRKKHKNNISNFCEKDYHGVCIPLYQMEKKIKASYNNGSD